RGRILRIGKAGVSFVRHITDLLDRKSGLAAAAGRRGRVVRRRLSDQPPGAAQAAALGTEAGGPAQEPAARYPAEGLFQAASGADLGAGAVCGAVLSSFAGCLAG